MLNKTETKLMHKESYRMPKFKMIWGKLKKKAVKLVITCVVVKKVLLMQLILFSISYKVDEIDTHVEEA